MPVPRCLRTGASPAASLVKHRWALQGHGRAAATQGEIEVLIVHLTLSFRSARSGHSNGTRQAPDYSAAGAKAIVLLQVGDGGGEAAAYAACQFLQQAGISSTSGR